MSDRVYIKKRDQNDPKRNTWRASTQDVIYDRVMTKTGYGMFSEQRPLEEQVKQCVEVMAELMEHLGVDASLFNTDYVKVGESNDG
jgi:hypothetical protein